jgi:hypothetical protein
MVLSISLSVYRYDLKTIKKQYKNSSKLVDSEVSVLKKREGFWGKTQEAPIECILIMVL